MSTKPQRSRQERALAQRTREFEMWAGTESEPPHPMMERCRRQTDHDDKGSKASRDVTALKAKLGKVEA